MKQCSKMETRLFESGENRAVNREFGTEKRWALVARTKGQLSLYIWAALHLMLPSSYLQVQVGYPDLPYFGASWAPIGSVWLTELFVISDLSLYFSYTALCGELIAEHLIMTPQVCVGLNGDVDISAQAWESRGLGCNQVSWLQPSQENTEQGNSYFCLVLLLHSAYFASSLTMTLWDHPNSTG